MPELPTTTTASCTAGSRDSRIRDIGARPCRGRRRRSRNRSRRPGRPPSTTVSAGARCRLAAELLRVARAHGLSPVQGDAERLPVGSQTVDAVLCVSAAAYFHHPHRALQEFARVLRLGGTCLVQTWCDGTISPTRILRQSAASAGIDIPDPNSALGSEPRLRQAMSAAGLTGVTIHERAWHAFWPDPDAAWRNAIQGLLGGPLSGLDSSRLARVETAFTSQLRALSTRHADDAQRLLIGVGIVG